MAKLSQPHTQGRASNGRFLPRTQVRTTRFAISPLAQDDSLLTRIDSWFTNNGETMAIMLLVLALHAAAIYSLGLITPFQG